MPRVTIVQVVFNSRRFIEPVFSAMLRQTYKDVEIVAVISGNDDHGKELIAEKFPQVKIMDLGFNIGFAAGHNLVFAQSDSEFFQLVNPDLILEPDYLEKLLAAFDDPKVGAATGKLYQISNDQFQMTNQAENPKSRILDTTGVSIFRSGRARDRGQHEEDRGQYDQLAIVQAVSAAGAMYRRSALEKVKCQKLNAKSQYEYFDEDFHSYWEDVDLAWRLANAGWKNLFVPSAVGYHGRGAGSSRGGYWHLLDFIAYHRKLPLRVRRLNYQNHIFMYVKNSPRFYPQFFLREFFMFWYILIFETSTLAVLPQIFGLLPRMLQKRKFIYQGSKNSRP